MSDANPRPPKPQRYRKKPVVIEAMQLAGTTGEIHAVYQWVEANTLGSFEPLSVLPDLLAQAWDQGLRAGQRGQEPCLLHDTTGEDVPGWEMAECTCKDLTNPYRKEANHG